MPEITIMLSHVPVLSASLLALAFALAGTAHAAGTDEKPEVIAQDQESADHAPGTSPTRAQPTFPPAGSLFTSITIGHHALASERGPLADEVYGEFGLGFRFTERLSLSLNGSRTESEQAGNPVDIDGLRFDSRWHLRTPDTWQPWIAVGVADQRIKTAGTDAGETLLTAGLGLFRHIGGPFALHLEWRAAYSLDHESLDHLAGLGLSVAFGGNYHGNHSGNH